MRNVIVGSFVGFVLAAAFLAACGSGGGGAAGPGDPPPQVTRPPLTRHVLRLPGPVQVLPGSQAGTVIATWNYTPAAADDLLVDVHWRGTWHRPDGARPNLQITVSRGGRPLWLDDLTVPESPDDVTRSWFSHAVLKTRAWDTGTLDDILQGPYVVTVEATADPDHGASLETLEVHLIVANDVEVLSPSPMSRPDESPAFQARPATEDDSEFVFRLRKAALGPYVEATWGWDDDYQRKLHDRRFTSQPLTILQIDAERVGSLLVERDDDEIDLVSIYLHPDWQSKGIGSQILASLVEEANARQVPIRLKVLRVNERAVALYERFGFKIVDTTATHHWMRRP